jgi:hypothetical protein
VKYSRWLDLAFYLVFGLDAAYTAVFNEFYGFRVWGNFAVAGYGFAVLYTVVLLATRSAGSRWVPVASVVVLGVLAPLVALVAKRMGPTGKDWGSPAPSMTAQPEVWAIERAGNLLWHTGSPYVDLHTLTRPVHVDDFTPYGPAMALLGLPSAVFGRSAVTDARVIALVVSVVVLAIAVKVAKIRLAVRPVQLVLLTTYTTLSAAVAGNDLPVVALLVLAAVLATHDRVGWAGMVLAVATSMKLTALPAAAVVAVAIWALKGPLGRFLGTFLAGLVVFTGFSAAVDFPAFIDNVIKFPANSAEVRSPAGSPLPGHLLEQVEPWGHAAVLVLMALAAVGVLWWLIARPPRTTPEILLRIGVSLGLAMLLMPATRWGYLIYPIALLGAALQSWRPAFLHRRTTVAA